MACQWEAVSTQVDQAPRVDPAPVLLAERWTPKRGVLAVAVSVGVIQVESGEVGSGAWGQCSNELTGAA